MNYEISKELLAATIGFLKGCQYNDVVVLVRNLEQCQPVEKEKTNGEKQQGKTD